MSLNLAVLLNESAVRHARRTAVILGETRFTYAELNSAANKVANALRSLGIQPGDKVAMMVPNVPEFPIIYYGILKLGATVVPLETMLKGGEIRYHLADSDAVALFCWEGYVEQATRGFRQAETCHHMVIVNREGSDLLPEGAISYGAMLAIGSSSFETVATMPDDTAVILYTSGTTGRPKGAELTHFNMFHSAVSLVDRLLGLRRDSVGLAVLPLFHSFGQTCLMNALFYAGGTLALSPDAEAAHVLEAIAAHRVTYFAAAPSHYLHLAEFPDAGSYDTHSLAVCISGGAAMPLDVLKAFESRFKVRIVEGYGLSETSAVTALNLRHRGRKAGSVGLPIWGTEILLVNEDGDPVAPDESGEILIRGPNVMKGYYKRPEATAEVLRRGWFHTGDIGRVDEDGFLYIVDRKKDTIVRNGMKLWPREVEDVLGSHPAVAEAAVVGVPDRELGEEVKAFVVLKPGAQATAQEIIAYCEEYLASYKYPRYIEFRDALPKGPTGKVLKKELRERYSWTSP